MNYIKNKIKATWKFVVTMATVAIGISFAASLPLGAPPITLENPQEVVWEKPTTDAGWAEDAKKESLHLKFDNQLADMKVSLEKKLPLHEADLDKIIRCPDCIRWELEEQFTLMFENEGNPSTFEGKTLQEWIDSQFIEELAQKTWESEKVKQSIERIDNEIRLRGSGFLTVIDKIPAGNPARKNIKVNERSPIGTTFFIDADCGTPGDGTTATCNGDADDSFDELLDFTEVARSAGDIATARRGTTATYDDSTDLLFTSDGASTNPIFMQADYGDAWGDFASSTETATLIFGSKTVTMSASATEVQAGKWIWAIGDDNKEFSYEVKSVSSATVTLYIPYKGAQAGAGVSIEVMPAAPIHGTIADTTLSVVPASDDFWFVQGIHFRSTDSGGIIDASISDFWIWKDVILESDGTTSICADSTDNTIYRKLRIFDCNTGITSATGKMFFIDSLLDGNSAASGLAINPGSTPMIINEIELINWASAIFDTGLTETLLSRNITIDGSTLIDSVTLGTFMDFKFEDFDNVIGDNQSHLNLGSATFSKMTHSTSTTVRSGGGATSIEVNPTTELSSNWEHSRIQLFEYPIHTDTTSRDYQVFFKSDVGTPFASSPTADELWIECEYWGDASNNFRQLVKSTGTVDFTTDADFDQSLTVTCASSQTGILYLRGWYAKTKEGGDDNIFFVDVQPVITDT